MGDLAAMIMSMDTLQLAGIGFATMGSIGLIAYGVLKKKPAKETAERKSALSDAALKSNKPRIEIDIDEAYTVNTQEELSQLRPRLSEDNQPTPTESGSKELVESALVYDGYGSKEEAAQTLREAMEQESHAKEKVRIHVIYKNYMAGTDSLRDLVNRYPTFIKNVAPVENEQKHTASKEEFDLFASKKDNGPVTVADKIAKVEAETLDSEPPVLDDVILTEIMSEAEVTEKYQAQNDEHDTQNFFQEFGELAKQIQQDNHISPKSKMFEEQPQPVFVAPVEKEIHDVWANYMSLYGGRMNLKNTFIHLEHVWGTIPGIAELQEKINAEIGKDVNGNQIPWAIISVLPLKDGEQS